MSSQLQVSKNFLDNEYLGLLYITCKRRGPEPPCCLKTIFSKPNRYRDFCLQIVNYETSRKQKYHNKFEIITYQDHFQMTPPISGGMRNHEMLTSNLKQKP